MSDQQQGIGGRARQFEVLKLRNIIYEISTATLEADATMSVLYRRLATRREVEELIELRIAEARARAEKQQRFILAQDESIWLEHVRRTSRRRVS